jgi:hypothetical protein
MRSGFCRTRRPKLARSIAELASRHAELVAEFAEVRAEIASRAGESDKPPAPKRTRAKAV